MYFCSVLLQFQMGWNVIAYVPTSYSNMITHSYYQHPSLQHFFSSVDQMSSQFWWTLLLTPIVAFYYSSIVVKVQYIQKCDIPPNSSNLLWIRRIRPFSLSLVWRLFPTMGKIACTNHMFPRKCHNLWILLSNCRIFVEFLLFILFQCQSIVYLLGLLIFYLIIVVLRPMLGIRPMYWDFDNQLD